MAREDQAEAARAAIRARLEREVDPTGALSPTERAPLVAAAARRCPVTRSIVLRQLMRPVCCF
jgi:hypothetical protein